MYNKACVAFLLLTLLWPRYSVEAASPLNLKTDEAILHFPDTITFRATIESQTEIRSVVLEYGTQEQTCGTVIAEAFPKLSPSKTADVEWTWEMKQSGSLPPGAVIWWRWHYVDANGQENVSERKTITWLDNVHPWRTMSDAYIRLHWYEGDSSFAKSLFDAAMTGLARIEQDAGLKADQPIDLFIYAGVDDLKDAILYEPSWVGGMAFPESNVVIIGIAPSDVDWGKRAEVHELTHVLVGHLTFTCLGDVPTWLNEGLAVYSEGDLDPAAQEQLTSAIRDDSLAPVRSLSGSFSEVSDRASLSYSESFSLVKFLIEKYGRDHITSLLVALREGTSVDAALQQVYGFDVDGLEDAWRAAVGARARSLVSAPTAVVTPTAVPTIVPVSGVLAAVSPTPQAIPDTPTPSFAVSGVPDTGFGAAGFMLIAACICVLVVLGMVVLIVIVMMRRSRKAG